LSYIQGQSPLPSSPTTLEKNYTQAIYLLALVHFMITFNLAELAIGVGLVAFQHNYTVAGDLVLGYTAGNLTSSTKGTDIVSPNLNELSFIL